MADVLRLLSLETMGDTQSKTLPTVTGNNEYDWGLCTHSETESNVYHDENDSDYYNIQEAQDRTIPIMPSALGSDYNPDIHATLASSAQPLSAWSLSAQPLSTWSLSA